MKNNYVYLAIAIVLSNAAIIVFESKLEVLLPLVTLIYIGFGFLAFQKNRKSDK